MRASSDVHSIQGISHSSMPAAPISSVQSWAAIGPVTAVAFELTCHLTGRYPPWWRGRRFDRPITAWACGDGAKSTREASQAALIGDLGAPGTGMLPPDRIISTMRRPGVPDKIDTVLVRHMSGGEPREGNDLLLGEADPTRALPHKLRVTVDGIRHIGNFSAHPIRQDNASGD